MISLDDEVNKYQITTQNKTYELGKNSKNSTIGLTLFTTETDQDYVGLESSRVDVSDQLMTVPEPLTDFFSRPIQIAAFQWIPGNVSLFFQTFNPWSLFFNNSRVINRLSNYFNLAADLHVRFLINGNPFYYGSIMVDYVPLHTNDSCTSINGLDPVNAVTASQRMHLLLDPCESKGGDMLLPFVYPYNAVQINTGGWNELGSINMRQMAQLKHANAALTPVEITVFAWASNVKVSVPTTQQASGLIAQGDEYDTKGPISGPASAISAAAGKLSKIPVIGPYAKATSMVMSTAASVAASFGYSRVPLIDAPVRMAPRYVDNVVNADLAEDVDKLTLDSKAELSIDPRIVGVDMPDEMTLSVIASKPSYIFTFPWTVAAAPLTSLFSCRITPHIRIPDSNGDFNLPACAFASLPFDAWRGTMRYHFRIIASQYHRGRIRVTYDPVAIRTLEANIAYTRVIDLADTREFTMEIAWSNPAEFLVNPGSISSNSVLSGANFSTAAPYGNGVMSIHVMNTLTVPNDTINNDISILVFASMCDDAKFAIPNELFNRYTPASALIAQGAEDGDDDDQEPLDKIRLCDIDNNRYLTYFGESIVSFRKLLARYAYYTSYTQASVAGKFYRLGLNTFPIYRGLLSASINRTIVPVPVAYAKNTLMHYLTPAFLAIRGGIRNRYVFSAPDAVGSVVVSRDVDSLTAESFTLPVTNIPTTPSAAASALVAIDSSCALGSSIGLMSQKGSITTEQPYYRRSRFDCAKNFKTLVSTGEPVAYRKQRLEFECVSNGRVTIRRYVAMGSDFALTWYQGSPPLTLDVALPAPSVTL